MGHVLPACFWEEKRAVYFGFDWFGTRGGVAGRLVCYAGGAGGGGGVDGGAEGYLFE